MAEPSGVLIRQPFKWSPGDPPLFSDKPAFVRIGMYESMLGNCPAEMVPHIQEWLRAAQNGD